MGRFGVSLVFFALSRCAIAQDFQSWNEVDLTASWHKVEFVIPLLARVDPGAASPQLAATGVTADVPLRGHLTATAGYLFVELPQSAGAVHVPVAALSGSFRWWRIELADRNRFEKLYGYGTAPLRYRNRLLVNVPFGRDRRWHALIDDEFFENLSAGSWNQNRLQMGGGTRLSRRVSLEAYYLRRNASGSSTVTEALGTNLRVL